MQANSGLCRWVLRSSSLLTVLRSSGLDLGRAGGRGPGTVRRRLAWMPRLPSRASPVTLRATHTGCRSTHAMVVAALLSPLTLQRPIQAPFFSTLVSLSHSGRRYPKYPSVPQSLSFRELASDSLSTWALDRSCRLSQHGTQNRKTRW